MGVRRFQQRKDLLEISSGFCRKENDGSKVEKVMGVFLKVLKETLSKGDKIKLHGFGSFETVQRKGKTGIHPKTGSPVKIKPRKTVVFHISPNCWVEK